MNRILTAAVAAAFAAPAILHAADAPKKDAKPAKKVVETFTDPGKAGPDYAVQGEYVGTLGDEKLGVQVIALGEGKFDVVLFRGGLPGDGWNGKDKHKLPAETTDGKVVVGGDVGTIADGRFTGKSPKGDALSAAKTERKSPTLGEKPPEGAIVLFDGKEETAKAEWNKGKLDEQGNLTTMVPGGLLTTRKFGDCKLHIEFRTPFMPAARGQGRGNSGVYLQGRYETQVLDSFGLSGENNECGGLYSVAKPSVNMCLPPLTWQTYDIEFTAAKFDADGKKTAPAKITVIHNGVTIHDGVEFPKGITTAAPVKEGPEPGPIHLQNHGNPVAFRNVWIVEKK